MDQILLKDIPKEKDYPIAHLLRVSDMQLREGKRGHFLQFTAGDRSGSFRWSKKWESSEEEYKRLKNENVLFITGKTDVYNDNLQVVADSLAIPEDPPSDLLNKLMPTTSYNINFLKKEVWSYIQKMENTYIKELTEKMITDDFVKSRLASVPAALSVHHSYSGGLLVHIYRLLVVGDKLVDAINDNPYPGKNPIRVNKDIIYFGLIVHDMFKVREYSPELTYEDDANLVNHLPMGAIEINRKMDLIDGFPDELRKQLTHVLLSHHGKIEWGSPVTPKTLESNIVHYLDVMLSRIDPMLEEIQKLNDGENWTPYLKCLGGSAYRGGSLIN